ncbi:GNAT family N-acetyltransferase [Flavobacterium pectinovorum]|uniref:GNAT family N-acetyltransferase n=1 Tax=Flavobacterium pectinovorum TaxID=29533 RepID=A0A502EVR4_9FLAO|nr:GNAT family N-acetyltransferase [Flavobacterium pectinovorum]TPG40211.1 GNAT family N-acetyltransferase [Flavobacterium pectinovorum]
MTQTLSIKTANPDDEKVAAIIEELSINLYLRFGSDGKNSFTDWQYNNSKFAFVIANLDNEIVGCGAIRPFNDVIGEVKRMYSKFPGKKIGQRILAFLEDKAKEIGYKTIPNYGKYTDRPEAICLGKSLNQNS